MRLSPLLLAAQATAFPYALEQLTAPHNLRDLPAESNCGPLPCTTFNAKEQYVSTSGENSYIKPTSKDSRGPCPGLNAAANHGYIPRSGILNTAQTVTGLFNAFGMGADIAAGLAVVAILLNGDPVALTWSIGGAYPNLLLPGFGEEAQGISWSHNEYEGDSSMTRQDAYLNNGDASSMVVSRFETMYNLAEEFTLANIRSLYKINQDYSINNNPYFFNAQFSGLLVVPAAHHFVINFFSNRSQENPNGVLNRETLKSFFGITGEPGSFVAHQGEERIPENWYRRPNSNTYDLTKALSDVARTYAEDPSTFKLGGNTGTVNSFTGVDVGDLTGGVFNSKNLLEGNNLGCFVILAQQMDVPLAVKTLLGQLSPLANLVRTSLSPALEKLNCPTLAKYNQGLFNNFPGYKYRPNSTDSPNGIGQGTMQ